jgi:hypothetical protein
MKRELMCRKPFHFVYNNSIRANSDKRNAMSVLVWPQRRRSPTLVIVRSVKKDEKNPGKGSRLGVIPDAARSVKEPSVNSIS